MWTVTKNRKNQKNVPKILKIFRNATDFRRRRSTSISTFRRSDFDVENTAHLRKIRGAKSLQMRPKCAKFRLKIRICDAFSPYLRRVFACDGASPSHLRIFPNSSYLRRIATADRRRKWELFFSKNLKKKNFENTANFGSICEVYFANGPKIRRVSEIFFADEKNYSHLRIIFRECAVFSP